MNLITIAMFAAILLISLGITAWAARRTRTTVDFYAAGKGLTAAQNGFALAGDWCSAAAFLGFTGLTALYGMDGALYAVGPLVAFCTVLLLIAEPLRNTGTYTIGDVIMYRMRQPPALAAAIVGTIVINLAYLIPQMAGAGVLIKLLFGIRYDVSVMLVGLGMIIYVAAGGMLATSWVQIIKAVLMLGAGAIILFLALAGVGFDPLVLFASAEAKAGPNFLLPGNFLKNPFDEVSLGLGYMLGLAGLPHVMTRFYTVPDATTARRSVIWVMFLAGAFFACTTIFGLAAVHYLGPEALRVGNPGGNLTLPLLAQYLGGGKDTVGGQLMLGFVSAVAVATILAVVAGLTLATSGAVANDLYVNLVKKGQSRGASTGPRCPHYRRAGRHRRNPARYCGRGSQRRGAGHLGYLHRGERKLPGVGAVAVLAALQYRWRRRRNGARSRLLGRPCADRTGLSRRQCDLAVGQSNSGRLAARYSGRGVRQPACRTRS